MRRNHSCPHCENNSVWNKAQDAGRAVWVCGLCGHKEPRKVRKTQTQRELSALIDALT